MKSIVKYFMNGLLFLIPVGVTIYVVYWVFNAIDKGVLGLVLQIADVGEDQAPVWWWTGLGVLLSLGVITGVGFLCTMFITRPIMMLIEKVFERLPLIKLMYSSIKDLIGAFVGEKKKFDQPVLVTLVSGSNAKALGFITRKSMEFLGLKDEVAVYFPQSYNFAGSVIIIPRDQVTPVEADSSEVMAFIVSGGVSGVGS